MSKKKKIVKKINRIKEILEEKINEERTSVTWAGFSIWVVITIIGILLLEMYKLIRINGINKLMNLESLFTIMSGISVILIVRIIIRRLSSNKSKIKPLAKHKEKYLYEIIIVYMYMIFVIIYANNSSLSIKTALLLETPVIAYTILYTLSNISITKYSKIKLFTQYYVHKFWEPFIAIFSIALLSYSTFFMDYGIYGVELGADILYFSIIILSLSILLFVLIYILNKMNQISILCEIKTELMIGNKKISEIELDFIEFYLGNDVEDYFNALEKKLDEMRAITPDLSELKKIAITANKVDQMIDKLKKQNSKQIEFAIKIYELFVYNIENEEVLSARRMIKIVNNSYRNYQEVVDQIKRVQEIRQIIIEKNSQ